MKNLKKALSLTLALVLALALAAPASAAGTTKTVVDEEHGVTITMDGFLRTETHRYNVRGDNESLTIYVLADNSTVTVEALEGWKYAATEEEQDVWYEYLWDTGGATTMPGYAWYNNGALEWDSNNNSFSGVGDVQAPLTGPKTYTVSPSDDVYIYLKEDYNIYWMCESDYAKLVPVDEQPTTPPAIVVEDIPASGTAKASTQTVSVDGKNVEFQMYALLDANGNQTNYIKLRDLAYILNGTKAQFNVGWDGAVNLETGKPYNSNGSEMSTPFSGDRAYTGGGQKVNINGSPVEMTAIILQDDAGGGYNYFKLRDLGEALGFNVGWSFEQGVYVETDKPYQG